MPELPPMKQHQEVAMYVILTNKPGKFHTEVDDGVSIIESYEYRFYGKLKAIYQIALLQGDSKIRIVEDEAPYVVNQVRSKFLDHFSSLDQARKELAHLTQFGSIDTSLVQCIHTQVPG
jgi:hypothetical protein